MNQFLNEARARRLFNIVIIFGIILIVFVAALAINALKENAYIGQGVTPTNTISVSGTGKVFAIPDIAVFSFSVTQIAKTVDVAQNLSATATNKIIDALKAMGIAENDIQTTGYNSYPKYQYTQTLCPQTGSVSTGSASGVMMPTIAYPPCTNNNQTITGYEVDQTITVKVRKIADAGKALTQVGSLGATNISGLNFVIDNTDAVQAQARDKAITDAKAKAQVLAKSLGVNLGRIVSFSESGASPIFYAMNAQAKSMGSTDSVVPQTPVGQNEIDSNVSITYSIN